MLRSRGKAAGGCAMRPSARIVQRVRPLAMVITRVPDYHVFVRMPGPHLSNLLFACYHLHLMSSTLFAESTAKQLAAVIMHHPAIRILPLERLTVTIAGACNMWPLQWCPGPCASPLHSSAWPLTHQDCLHLATSISWMLKQQLSSWPLS